MVETERAQSKIAKIEEKQRRINGKNFNVDRKSLSLNPFPVTYL